MTSRVLFVAGLAAVLVSSAVTVAVLVYGYGASERGIKTFDDGARYEGELRDGEPHGEGVLMWPDGTRYVGEFRVGRKHGPGVFTSPDGTRAEGTFRDGMIYEGVVTSPDGSRYVCEIGGLVSRFFLGSWPFCTHESAARVTGDGG